jgi:FKBP-type peptidyl-prolyl cis-trans isomerase
VKSKIIYLLAAVLLYSCTDPVYKGYTETDTGLFYKLRVIGDGKKKPSIGDYLQLRITYKTGKDSTFLDSYSINETGMVILPFNHSSFKGSFEEGLTTMNEGDSVSFIVDAAELFKSFFRAELPVFLKTGDRVKMEVKLNRIMNAADYAAAVKDYQDMIADRDIEEQRKLQTFLDTSQTHFSFFSSGMYYMPLAQGAGNTAETGDLVKVNYKGMFLDGRSFESTYERGQPLEFRLGEQGQVLKGIELGISLLNEGAKAKFIIPSQLAFGEGGSSTGIVPPYSTVIYEIELLSINKK